MGDAWEESTAGSGTGHRHHEAEQEGVADRGPGHIDGAEAPDVRCSSHTAGRVEGRVQRRGDAADHRREIFMVARPHGMVARPHDVGVVRGKHIGACWNVLCRLRAGCSRHASTQAEVEGRRYEHGARLRLNDSGDTDVGACNENYDDTVTDYVHMAAARTKVPATWSAGSWSLGRDVRGGGTAAACRADTC